jgi:outer membrane lipoprotein SlyB
MQAMKLGLVFTAAALLGLGGCAYPGYGGADYRGYQTGTEQTVRFGVVESVRVVRIDAPQTGVGAASGAVLGGIAGSNVGGGSGAAAAAVAGALLGSIIGSHIEADANAGNGIEITVLLDGGRYIAVVQAADETFRVGDRVRVLSGQGITRVAR